MIASAADLEIAIIILKSGWSVSRESSEDCRVDTGKSGHFSGPAPFEPVECNESSVISWPFAPPPWGEADEIDCQVLFFLGFNSLLLGHFSISCGAGFLTLQDSHS